MVGCGDDTPPTQPPLPIVHGLLGADAPYDITSDGKLIVYRHQASVEGVQGVYSLDLGTGGGPLLVMPDSASYLATQCRFSPDGMRLIYLRNFSDLYILDLTTNEQTQVTFTSGNASSPDWDPSGRYIVYERPFRPFGVPESLAGLRILDTVTLDDYSLRHNSEPTFGSNPRWSPDSLRITFDVIGPWNGVPGSPTRFHIFSVSLVDTEYADLTPNDLRNNEFPIWLDSTRILFESYDEQTFNIHRSQVINRDGTGRSDWIIDLRPYLGFMAAAPTKNLFVYPGPDSAQKYAVLLLRDMTDVAGSTIRQLTTFTPLSPSAHTSSVAVSPASLRRRL